MKKRAEGVSRQEQAIKQFLRRFLDTAKGKLSLHDVLADLGAYYDADRAYIFELSEDRVTRQQHLRVVPGGRFAGD